MRSSTFAATAFAVAVLGPPAHAELANNPDEIIVTARKRQESILTIPVVETALPGSQLEKFAAPNIEAIADQVPDRLFGRGTSTYGAQVSLRGVGTNTLNASHRSIGLAQS